MINVERLSKFCEFEKLKESWNRLRENQSGEDMIFLAHEWFDCWWRCYADDAQLFILEVKENDRLLGIAPLMLRKALLRGLPIRLLSFIDNGNSGHNDFIIEATRRREVLKAMFSYLREYHKEWDVLELKRIPPESSSVRFIQDVLRSEPIPFLKKAGTDAPYLRIEHDWRTFYNRLSNKKKKTLRNIQNRISREGGYVVKRITDFHDYQAIKPDLRDIVRNSWSAHHKSSLNRPENINFIDGLSLWAGSNGFLQLWLLSVNNQPIAYEYHLRYRNRVHGLRSSFNKNFGHLSPGAFLDYQIIKYYHECGEIAEYDMGGSADFYKRQWTKNVRRHTTFHIFSLNPYSRIVYFYELFSEFFLKHFRKYFL